MTMRTIKLADSFYTDEYVKYLESQLEGKILIPEELSEEESNAINDKMHYPRMTISQAYRAIVLHFKELKE